MSEQLVWRGLPARTRSSRDHGDQSAENRELRKRLRLLEQENEVLHRAAAYLEGEPAGKMMYPPRS